MKIKLYDWMDQMTKKWKLQLCAFGLVGTVLTGCSNLEPSKDLPVAIASEDSTLSIQEKEALEAELEWVMNQDQDYAYLNDLSERDWQYGDSRGYKHQLKFTDNKIDQNTFTRLAMLSGSEKIDSLYFDDCSIVTLDGIEQLPGLKSVYILDLGKEKTSSYEALSQLSSLQDLTLWTSYDKLTTVEYSKLDHLKSLKLELTGFYEKKEDYSLMKFPTSLEKLSLDFSTISEENNFSYLPHLKELYLSTDITSLDVLQNNKELELLDLRKYGFSDSKIELKSSSPLDLPKLQEVNIYGYSVPDLSFLKEVSLTSFEWNGMIEDPSLLSTFTTLNKLQLNGPMQIPDLSKLTKLEELYFYHVTETNFLKTLPKSLLSVTLESGNYTNDDFQSIGRLPNLRLLEASKNCLTNLDFIEKFPKLFLLNVADNQLCQIELSKSYPKLISINLGNNQLTNLHFLSQMPKLKNLTVDGNHLTTLDGLEFVPTLNHLSAGNNNIREIHLSQVYSKLTTLNLENNQLTNMDFLTYMPFLKELNVKENPLPPCEDWLPYQKNSFNSYPYEEPISDPNNECSPLDLGEQEVSLQTETPKVYVYQKV